VLRDEQAKELIRQLTEGNGYEKEETRGLTLRELVLELRDEQKNYPTRKEVYTVLGVITAVFGTWAGLV
jgi:hypothetical protein